METWPSNIISVLYVLSFFWHASFSDMHGINTRFVYHWFPVAIISFYYPMPMESLNCGLADFCWESVSRIFHTIFVLASSMKKII